MNEPIRYKFIQKLFTGSLTPTRPLSPPNDTTNNEPLLYTVENFIPLPDSVNVPEKLRPFIPQVPVYNKKKTVYYPPGSHHWFNVIKRRAKKAEKSAQLEQSIINSHDKTLKMQNELQQSANLHGTSAKRFHGREELKSDLTTFQNEFHKKMSSFAQRRQRAQKKPKKQADIHKEWMAFNLNFFDVIQRYSHIYRSNRSETSEETKELEKRPHKRNSSSNFNLDSHYNSRQDKKFRPTIGSIDDSPTIGPSDTTKLLP
jgi:hypothetical protein